MQILFPENPNHQLNVNGHLCVVHIHTKPSSRIMTHDTPILKHQYNSQLWDTIRNFWCHIQLSAQIQQYNNKAYKTTSTFAFEQVV